MSHDEQDPLDDLLNEAEWPAVTPEQIAWLTAKWDDIRPRMATGTIGPRRAGTQRRRTARLISAAAVACVVMVGCWLWRLLSDVAPIAEPGAPLAGQLDEAPTPREPQHAGGGRLPTAYESLVLRSSARRVRQRIERRAADPIERAIEQLLRDPHADVSALVGSMRENREAATQRLAAAIPQWRGARLEAGIRLLEELGGEQVILTLITLWREPATRTAAEPALQRQADLMLLARLALEEETPARQARWLGELLNRGDEESNALFLKATVLPATRKGALAAAAAATNPPTDFLFAALSSSESHTRTAAALLLGEVHDPQAAPRLVRLARENPLRQEVLVALLPRPEPEAVAFLHQARRHPRLLAALHSASGTRRLAWLAVPGASFLQ